MSNQAAVTVFEVFVECKNLRDEDFRDKSDPMCILEVYDPVLNETVEVGTTETIRNNLNPKFDDSLKFQYVFGRDQKLTFKVFDMDDGGKKRGPVLFEQVISASDFIKKMQHEFKQKKSTLLLTYEKVQKSNEVYTIILAATNVKKMDFFGKSDPFVMIYREVVDDKTNKTSYVLVHRTEVIKNTATPKWQQVRLTASELCNGDRLRRLKFEVYDWDADDKFELIGTFLTSVDEIDRIGKKQHTIASAKGKDHGTFLFEHFATVRYFTFTDFIQAGMPIQFIAAIDYTGSNGHPGDADSLHFIGGSSANPYEQAMRGCARVLFPFDRDGADVIGFGGEFNGATSHCFALGEAKDEEQMITIYRRSFSAVQLSGPTYFSEILRHSAGKARSFDGYTVLMIMTDGQANDFDRFQKELAAASALPLSVVIVGVGRADFGMLQKIDDGVSGGRDIVQFVEFNKYARSPELLASEVMKEIPEQLEQFARMNNWQPNRFRRM